MVMNDYLWDKAILDTDFALKLERVQKINALEKYLPFLIGHTYVHRYVYENEILIPKRTKVQINHLIEKGKASIGLAE
ncbi:hypothetical protein [Heyndrickxia coagulans]|uniref:hypothetical protein n=1 Tax=Heyndrickxia coagulans TaxID=1398 RepID=UPI0022365413|nr:hypothetical protein [Heyndrickxia coagulans]UZH06065.1 hypothetical protein ONG97_14615 [Heyndrickxia coagulans]